MSVDKPLNWTFWHTIAFTAIVVGILYVIGAPPRFLVYVAVLYPTMHVALKILRP